MVTNRITEGVGKKIVEALKQQSDIEIQNVVENPTPMEDTSKNTEPVVEYTSNSDDSNDIVYNEELNENDSFADSMGENSFATTPDVMTFSQPSIMKPIMERESYNNDLEDFEIPTNVAVLKQLINQLPAGVSKQTGAQIIKQTMEALGISMKSVLQEAQQVQETLNSSARDCQNSIMEYKKQIGILEKQSQKFQRQYAVINDIISLFIQTSL